MQKQKKIINNALFLCVRVYVAWNSLSCLILDEKSALIILSSLCCFEAHSNNILVYCILTFVIYFILFLSILFGCLFAWFLPR